MIKGFNQKLEKWTAKDIVLNVLVYVLNVALIMLIFSVAVYLENLSGTTASTEKPLHFFFLLVLSVFVMFIFFLFEDRNFIRNPVNSEMIFLVIEITYIICFVSTKYLDIYLRPLSLSALLILFLVGGRAATFVNLLTCIVVLLMDLFTGASVQFGEYVSLVMGVSAGILGVWIMQHEYSRGKMLALSFVISIPALICAIMSIVGFETETTLNSAIISIASAVLSGPFTVCVFIVLLPIFEGIFQKVTRFKLAELTVHKARLVRKLINVAPGTFNHSIVVSNIAEACATAIGDDALLARTCAYYHDIGKIRRPEYFGENQADGKNPHNDLAPELSTNIIKSHTQDGYSYVLRNGLPKEIADVCLQHHGTLPIIYFYDKAKKFTDGTVDITQYCYPGPKPQTKIAAIIMIADGCEAAARTIKNRSRENVMQVVRKIVNDRMALGQFDECDITIQELNIIIHTVVNNLTGIYHRRVEYPKVSLEGIDKDKL